MKKKKKKSIEKLKKYIYKMMDEKFTINMKNGVVVIGMEKNKKI